MESNFDVHFFPRRDGTYGARIDTGDRSWAMYVYGRDLADCIDAVRGVMCEFHATMFRRLG